MGAAGRAASAAGRVGPEPVELAAQAHDVAHDHEGRGLDAGPVHPVGEGGEGALDDPLALGRPLLDEGGRGRGSSPCSASPSQISRRPTRPM